MNSKIPTACGMTKVDAPRKIASMRPSHSSLCYIPTFSLVFLLSRSCSPQMRSCLPVDLINCPISSTRTQGDDDEAGGGGWPCSYSRQRHALSCSEITNGVRGG